MLFIYLFLALTKAITKPSCKKVTKGGFWDIISHNLNVNSLLEASTHTAHYSALHMKLPTDFL